MAIASHVLTPQIEPRVVLFFSQLQEADIVVLGSPKPEDVPLSWIQPETIVLNCSHDLLSGECVTIGARLLIKKKK